MAAAYDRIASDYARINAAMPPAVEQNAACFLALLPPAPRILDVGCGTGRDMAWFEEHGAIVTGIDLSPGMLAEARTRVRGELLCTDMRAMALSSAHFHGVWCSASLLHLPKAEASQALAEMRRVLVPGGILFLAVQEGTGEGWERVPYIEVETVERLFSRYSSDEAENLLRQTGFAVRERGYGDSGKRQWLHFLAESHG